MMSKKPLLYYRTLEQISAYKKLPAIQKLKWLEMQMEFYYYAMPKRSKQIRERLKKGIL
jgi:hypothetical protein